MKKLRLDVEELQIDSFDTATVKRVTGTVRAYVTTGPRCSESDEYTVCYPMSCDMACGTYYCSAEPQTCGVSCGINCTPEGTCDILACP